MHLFVGCCSIVSGSTCLGRSCLAYDRVLENRFWGNWFCKNQCWKIGCEKTWVGNIVFGKTFLQKTKIWDFCLQTSALGKPTLEKSLLESQFCMVCLSVL